MADSFYSFSEPLNSGVDFYFADKTQFGLIGVSGNVTLQVTSIKLSHGVITLSADAALTATSYKFAYAQVNISDILATTLTLGTKIQPFLVPIYIESSLVAVGTKIAYAQAAITIDSETSAVSSKIAYSSSDMSASVDLSPAAMKFSFAEANIPVSSSLSVDALRIRFVSSLISVLGNVTTVPNASTVNAHIFLATIRININTSNSETRAQMIRFSPNITADSSLIRALLLLDGVPLTNQSRTLDISTAPVFIENNNWAGDSSRYYKNSAQYGGSKRTFNAKWSFIPNRSDETVDYRESRNYLKDAAMDSDIHTLTIINQDESGITPYTEESISVFITNFNEKLLRRDLVSGVYYFDCAMTLEEV